MGAIPPPEPLTGPGRIEPGGDRKGRDPERKGREPKAPPPPPEPEGKPPPVTEGPGKHLDISI